MLFPDVGLLLEQAVQMGGEDIVREALEDIIWKAGIVSTQGRVDADKDGPAVNSWNWEERVDGWYYCRGDHPENERCSWLYWGTRKPKT